MAVGEAIPANGLAGTKGRAWRDTGGRSAPALLLSHHLRELARSARHAASMLLR